jgi:hypothetical protein
MIRLKNRKGIALILVFLVFVGLSGVTLAFLTMVNYGMVSAGAGLKNMQAFYIAEAGLARARWDLTTGGQTVGWGRTDMPFGGEGTYTFTTVDNDDGTYTITADGYVPDRTNPAAQRSVVEANIPVVETGGAGNNLSLGATATASSEQGKNRAGNANDGNTGTKWKSSDRNGSWLKLDFGTSTVFDRIVVINGANINSYAIEYSIDDISYPGVANIVESPPWTFTFDSVDAQYVRLTVNGNRPEMAELETYNTADAGGGSVSLGQGEFSTLW